MRKSEQEKRIERVIIAVTELAPVQQMWGEALQFLDESRAEIHAVFVEDERWYRAASLPFTREISRVSGVTADFTMQRAIEVHEEAIDRTQQQLQQLATEGAAGIGSGANQGPRGGHPVRRNSTGSGRSAAVQRVEETGLPRPADRHIAYRLFRTHGYCPLSAIYRSGGGLRE